MCYTRYIENNVFLLILYTSIQIIDNSIVINNSFLLNMACILNKDRYNLFSVVV